MAGRRRERKEKERREKKTEDLKIFKKRKHAMKEKGEHVERKKEKVEQS